jgi:hypothetical protein
MIAGFNDPSRTIAIARPGNDLADWPLGAATADNSSWRNVAVVRHQTDRQNGVWMRRG